MIRAIRPSAMAQSEASMISGWNIAPNLAYTVVLLPGPASCGVLLYDEDGSTMIGTGAALTGTAQPCILIPQSGQTVGMVDADLGWHMLLTTIGTESQRTIRIGHAVDLPDEIHPVYGDDELALARATAAINAAAHYIDDVTVTCPLGLGAGLGDVVSVPVDGVAVVGQVESVTWTATPDGTTETAVIKRHVPIAPEAAVEIIPPTVADDTGTATHLVGTSGNVLANDESGLTIVAVNGLSANVGVTVAGDNGGSFVINSDGSWTFNPDGGFALLEGAETADTSVTYHASDGTAEAMATLTVTVSHANAAPVAVDDTGATTADATTSGNVLTNDTDADGDTLTVSQVNGSAGNVGVAVAGSSGGLFTIANNGAWTFDPDSDFDSLTGTQTATTGVTYHVSDGIAEDEGTLTITVSAVAGGVLWTPAEITGAIVFDALDSANITLSGSAVTAWADMLGSGITAAQGTTAAQPSMGTGEVIFAGDYLTIASSNAAAWCKALHSTGGHILALVKPFETSNPNAATGLCGTNGAGATANVGMTLYFDDRSAVPRNDAIVINATRGVTGTNSVLSVHADAVTGGAYYLVDVIIDPDNATALSRSLCSIDGADDVSANAATNAASTANATYSFQIGAAGNNVFPLTGRIKCFAITPIVLTATEREKFVGWAAHRHDQTALLPSDHPYKSAPPTI